MGRVYKAEDKVLGRTVALKFLAPELASNPASVERFLREARMLADLDHRHICTIHEIGQDEDGTWFIAMAYYEGENLKTILARGALDRRLAMDYSRQAALGLAYAHGHGIVHRDIKPANLIVNAAGELTILDFGVARLLRGTQHTAPGALVGTYGYLAPEQTRGEPVTQASDIWSLGVVLFEMIAGKLPFHAEDHAAQLYAIAHEEPETLPVDDDPESAARAAIVARCLAKEPADRYSSAAHLAADLGEILGTGTLATVGMMPGPSAASVRPPRRVLFTVLGAVLALVLVFLGPDVLQRVGVLAPDPDDTGVAVLALEFLGDSDAATAALGRGLSWYVANRLVGLDPASEAFWIVPPDDLLRYGVVDRNGAVDRFGVGRVVTGTGRMNGSNIALQLVVSDERTGERLELEFQDMAANLTTWQQDLVDRLATTLDPELEGAVLLNGAPGCTSVPGAFLDYCRGVGYLQEPGAQDDGTQDLALATLARAVAADSSFTRARAEWGYRQWRRHARDDSVLAAAGRRQLAEALRVTPSLVRPYLLHGRILQDEGDLDGALTAFAAGLSRNPEHADLLEARGDGMFRAGNSEDAGAAYQRSIAVRPGYAPGYEHMGRFLLYSGDFEGAEAILRHAVDVTPRNHVALLYLGACLHNGRKDPAAEDALLESLAIRPTAGCYSNLGTFYYYWHRYEDARLAYQSALALAPDEGYLWRNLAEAYRWSPGLEDSAQVAYERAVSFVEDELAAYPDSPELLADLASFHTRLGNEEQALALLATLAQQPLIVGDNALTAAVAYEDLGLRDAAIAHLDSALAMGVSHTSVENYPGFRNLRADARYRELMDRYR